MPFEPGLLLRVWITAQLVEELLDDEFRRHGLSQHDFAVSSSLRLLQPVTPTALAAALGVPPTTLSAALARLERRGHLVRTANPEDGRSHLLELTPDGLAAVEAALPAFRGALERLREQLGERRDEVAELLGVLDEALRAALASPAIS
jgi:DNA-binding MarR family transcriptional regulator